MSEDTRQNFTVKVLLEVRAEDSNEAMEIIMAMLKKGFVEAKGVSPVSEVSVWEGGNLLDKVYNK